MALPPAFLVTEACLRLPERRSRHLDVGSCCGTGKAWGHMRVNEKLIGSLCGLAGAVSNHGKTENTDRIVADVILNAEKALTPEQENFLLDTIEAEKNRISPDCRTCLNPCGNTSEYTKLEFLSQTKEWKELKYDMMHAACEMLRRIPVDADHPLPDTVYKTLVYWKYRFDQNAYRQLIEECERTGI